MSRLLFLLALIAGCARVPAPRPISPVADAALSAELIRMGEEDQAAREGFAARMTANDTAYIFRLMRGDSARTRRLREIIAQGGWPRVARVGKEAVFAAWLVVQHSASHEFQREMLPLLDSISKTGEIPGRDVAQLIDRVLVNEGKPQRYGNSFALVGGRLIPHPIEDMARLEELRAGVGLPPMTEYVKLLQEMYNVPVDWPPPS